MNFVLWTIILLLALWLSYWVLIFICSCLVDTKRLYDKHSGFYRWLLVSSTWHLIFVGRVRFHTTGMEKIPKNQRFVLVCNHRSKLEPITSWYLLRQYDLAFISKEENFHVPCWGRLIRRCCFLPIDRENPRNAMKTIEMAANLIKDDQVSIAVYPEGTRNYGKGILPYHSGVFKIAQKANVPVVICGMWGPDQMKKNFPLHGTDIYFDVLDVLSAEQVKSMRCNDIGEHARNLMLSYVEKKQ